MNTFSVAIGGMTGDVCIEKVRHALGGVLGFASAAVTVGRAVITYDPAVTTEVHFRNAIRAVGFAPAA